MTPLDRAIFICGTQTELARRVTGKPATGHVYHWLRNGVSEIAAIEIERAQRECIAEDVEAACRADSVGGLATVEMIRPDRVWTRGPENEITRYSVAVDPALSGKSDDADPDAGRIVPVEGA